MPPYTHRGTESVRRPLDAILGTEANVRLLRMFATQTPGPLNAEEASRRTGLTPPGARKGLERLVGTGIVSRTCSGRSQQFMLNGQALLTVPLVALFNAEQDQFDDLIRALRVGLSELPQIESAWLVALPSGLREPLHIAVVVSPRDLPSAGSKVRSRIAEVERTFDQVIEVSTHLAADAPRFEAATAVPLVGAITPAEVRETGIPMTHQEKDQRSLDTAGALVRVIRDDPAIVTRAKRYLDRQISQGQGMATADLAEWRQLLETYSIERLIQFLESTSERAYRLRQSSPFLAILTPEERVRLAEFRSGKR